MFKKLDVREKWCQPSEKHGFIMDVRKNLSLYLLFSVVLLYYLIFHYVPIWGNAIAFQDYVLTNGVLGSRWVGLKHFKSLFNSAMFGRLMFNTLYINIVNLLFSFPTPILLALLINEVKCIWAKKLVQTVSYMPYFISIVVICGLIRMFVSTNGIVTQLLHALGLSERTYLLGKEAYFLPIYVISGIWQSIGWNSIIYLAAIVAIDTTLYEAAAIDGAGKLRQVFVITLPSILPTVATLLILAIGGIMASATEKILLLTNGMIVNVTEVFGTYIYKKGIQEMSLSFSTAAGLFNCIINLAFILAANRVSRSALKMSIW